MITKPRSYCVSHGNFSGRGFVFLDLAADVIKCEQQMVRAGQFGWKLHLHLFIEVG
jgi:hypothetical protein